MATDGIEIDLNNIPDDPQEALRLLEQIERGEQPTQAPAPTAAPTPAPAAAAPAPAPTPAPAAEVKVASQPSSETQQTAATSTEEPAGVATKDGKHVIPYSVLTSTRDRATRAEQLVKEMTDRVTALEQSIQAAANGAKPGATARAADAIAADAPAMSDADLEALKEDFPTVYKALKAQQAYTASLEQRVQEQAGFRQEVEASTQRSVEETVQDAIDANPKIAFIQSSDPEAFKLASQFDDTLKESPAWKDKPMSERFAKVIEMVEAATGEIKLPGVQTKPNEQPTATAADLKAAAQAAAAAATTATRTNVPTSLSEFPVGDPPAQSEAQALASMSQQQLAEKLGRMTPDQMDAYFATL